MKMTLIYKDNSSNTEIKLKFELPGTDYNNVTVQEWKEYIQQQECYKDLEHIRTEVEVEK